MGDAMPRLSLRVSRRCLKIALVCAATFAATVNARAGVLILKNESNATLNCHVDADMANPGRPHANSIAIGARSTRRIAPSHSTPIINSATCGSLTARPLHITPDGPNGILVFNGQQTRVLNASLYPYIPNPPNATFDKLIAHVIATYQQQNPQVLLSVVMNQQVNIYSFSELPKLLGAQGFNVMELDTVMLGYLVSHNLINPAHIAGDQPWPAALAGSTYDNQLWGVPSWMCSNFIFSSYALPQITNLSQLLKFLNSLSSEQPKLAADFDGSWNIPSMYINGYVQTYGYGNIGNAMRMPPDPTVINNLVKLTETCAFNGTNNCINNYYHNQPSGTTEALFAKGVVGNVMGFSEQSFYINWNKWPYTLFVVTAPFGQFQKPLLYNDAFVTSRTTCALGTNCASDAQALSTLMTSTAMKDYIVMSQDMTSGSPWRTLLVATQPFYQRSKIKNNWLYRQFIKVFANGEAYPNNFTSASQTAIYKQVCAAMKAKEPSYYCGSAMAPPHAHAEYRK